MKTLAIILSIVFLMFSSTALAGQSIVCDPAPENQDADSSNDVVKVVILKDTVEITASYVLIPEINKVRLMTLNGEQTGQYQFAFENSQGRRSTFVSFDLQSQPNGCNGIQIIDE